MFRRNSTTGDLSVRRANVTRLGCRAVWLAAAAACAWPAGARANSFDWSAFAVNLGPPLNTHTPPSGGTGNWDLTTANWLDTTPGTQYYAN